MNLLKFYRIEDWYLNLGIGLLGVAAAGNYNPLSVSIVLGQLALVQMYAFSMNDYYDFLYWNEKNYISKILQTQSKKRAIIALIFLPLALAFLSELFIAEFKVLLLFGILPLLYNGPPRLKNSYLISIMINGVGLGGLMFFYPYLALGGQIDLLSGFFFGLFSLYMIFFEIAHQFEHQNKDNIKSIIDAFGHSKAYNLARSTLLAIVISSAFLILLNNTYRPLFGTALIFNSYRYWRTSGIEEDQMKYMRERQNKFYILYESIIYLLILILGV